MTLSPIQRNHLDYALRMNGYHIDCEVDDGWVAADATFAPGRCFLAYLQVGQDQVIVATSLAHVAAAFADEGGSPATAVALPVGAIAAFLTDLASVHAAVRRIFALSRSLPSAPLDRFQEKTRALGAATEAERLVVQRIGQALFRDALMDFWSGGCAITGLEQPEVLKASHTKPWAECASDEERLDPYNGLLLAAHWDAAFDCGLVTFEDDGALRLSERLSPGARKLFLPNAQSPARLSGLKAAHLPYLRYHRECVWRR
jgi:putative restriction endonuclease